MGVINYYGSMSCQLYFLLTSTEIIILKVSYIYKFSTISAVNEYFLKDVLITFNVVLIGVYILSLLTLKEFELNPSTLLSCFRSQNPLSQLLVRTDAQDNAEL